MGSVICDTWDVSELDYLLYRCFQPEMWPRAMARKVHWESGYITHLCSVPNMRICIARAVRMVRSEYHSKIQGRIIWESCEISPFRYNAS